MFDLAVDDAHEFHAGSGSLLIHNCEEIGSWKNIKETWDEGVEFSTRIGSSRHLLTGTPKRGNPLVKEFHDRGVAGDPDVLLVRGRTMDNAANLSDVFLRTIRAKYEGTTLGRQELEGLLLADAEGAVVTTLLIDATRVRPEDVPELRRVVVAVDPAVTSRPNSDHTGIVVVGIGGPPEAGYLGQGAVIDGRHLYVLADESIQASPRAWAERVLKTAETWAADAIVAETNQGGDLVETMLRMVAAMRLPASVDLPLAEWTSEMLAEFQRREVTGYSYRMPRFIGVHASVGKRTRAEPVAGVWEQARVHVVGGLPDVEDQFAGWTPGDADSPDQFDATVWGAVQLMPELGVNSGTVVRVLTGRNGAVSRPA